MRARMAIGVAGCEVEHREILLSDRPAELHAISSQATVPCLQITSNEVLTESMQIMRWALNQADPASWLPNEEQVATVEDLIATNDGEFKHNLDRFKYSTRYEDADPLLARSKAEQFLTHLESRLTKHQQLLSNETSIADVAIFPFVRQFSRTDREWFATAPYEALRRWVSWWESNPPFRRVMTKIPTWKTGDATVNFKAAFPQ